MQDSPYAAPTSDIRGAVPVSASEIEMNAPSKSSISNSKMRVWESVVSWLILVIALLGLLGPILMITSNWHLVQSLYYEGKLDFLPMVFPFVFIASAVLLILRRKWCLALFIVHFIVTLTYMSFKIGFDNLAWSVLVGYAGEVAIIYFCLHLLGKRILK